MLLQKADACAVGGIIASSRVVHNKSHQGNLNRIDRLDKLPVEMLIGAGPEKFFGIYMIAREFIHKGQSFVGTTPLAVIAGMFCPKIKVTRRQRHMPNLGQHTLCT